METKICLVCGMEIKEGNISREYKGQTYSFCCEGCTEEFKEEPQRYCDDER